MCFRSLLGGYRAQHAQATQSACAHANGIVYYCSMMYALRHTLLYRTHMYISLFFAYWRQYVVYEKEK